MNAIWYDDWDVHSDKIYKRPCCPECRVPIGKLPSGEYRCYSCGEIGSERIEVVGNIYDDGKLLKEFNEKTERSEEAGDGKVIFVMK